MAVNAQNTGLHLLTPGGIPCDSFVLNIKLISMVNSLGVWTGTFNHDAKTATFHNHALSQAERVKNNKPELHYAAIGFDFAPLI